MSIKTEDGFTLVELMITMVVFVLAMVAASNIFTGILTQFKQQSSIASSNIEGIGGLELLRHDVEQAGFGLPWNLNNANFRETADTVMGDASNALYDATNFPAVFARAYNDTPGNAPRAVVVGNNVLMNNSDVLVIKATNVANNAASQKWEYIVNNGPIPNDLRTWDASSAEKIDDSNASPDHVIIINPSAGTNVSNQKVLMNSGGFDVQLNDGKFSFKGSATAHTPFEPPANSYTAYIAYGVSPSSSGPLRMPFNRADFYIKRPADIPSRCATGTGVLYKATVNHADGLLTELPLLDCVLDMQVTLMLDNSGSGAANAMWGLPADIFALTAQQVRTQLKEIRIYLIVQEGQRDDSYTYDNQSPMAGCTGTNMVCINDVGVAGNNFIKAVTVPDLNYRWKLLTIVITPYNL